jgi:hypothetical protein
VEQEGCNEVPFEPGVEVDPGTTDVDSPAPAAVNTTLEYFTGEESEIEESHLKRAEVTMPSGMGVNPSAANGLVACTDAQFKKGVRAYDNECPAGSKVGTIEIETPPLPSGSLKGDLYVGTQNSSDPASGEMFRILAEAKSEALGIDVRLVGNVKADPNTGQLTTVFDQEEVGDLAGALPSGLPQVPFESVKLHFNGAIPALTSPPTCSESETTGAMEPWANPGTTTPVSHEFALSSFPGGGACPQTLSERPFAPGFTADTRDHKAGAYSAFDVHVTRPDGAQELKRLDVTLPPGLTAKLKGVAYCPEDRIAAAAASSGAAQLANPSCPDSSLLGTVGTNVGTGSQPLHMDGKAYLAGPYKGAPLSLVTVTPAVAGPYDLGTVVIRAALNVDPETTVVHAVSDPIPDVFGGVRLDIRSIDISLDRAGYTLNPTSCNASAVAGELYGGGANPADPNAWVQFKSNTPFSTTDCEALKFKPKFYARILGGKKQTRRTANPKFRAILQARQGDANLLRAAFILPKATILDQGHIGTICTRVQLAAASCPKKSVYGNAKATSPLLDGNLTGPVYLTSSNHQLPDLLVDLQGQVNVRLRGVISAVHGRLKTVFSPVPDVPVNKFTLTMKGGNQGLLVNSKNLCGKTRSGSLNLKAQNGKRVKNKHLRLNIPACGKGKRKGKHKR